MERKGYGFTPEAKDMIRERADGACEFPGFSCELPNTGKVNHITGCFEARLSGMDRQAVADPELNAIMLCEPHELHHDGQERFQVESLLGERHFRRRRR